MKRKWLVLSLPIIAVILTAIIVLSHKDYVQGRLEVWYAFPELSSSGRLILQRRKPKLITDAIYEMEFLPFCELVKIEKDKETNSFYYENGAIYRAKGNITPIGPRYTKDGTRMSGYNMEVYYLEFIKSSDKE